MRREERKKTRCIDCGNDKLIYDHARGEIVCEACGAVQPDSIIDLGQEWRAFNHEQLTKRSRAGSPLNPLIHDFGMSTLIDGRNKDAFGKELTNESKKIIHKIKNIHKKLTAGSPADKCLINGLNLIDRYCTFLDLSNQVKKDAAEIFRKVYQERLIRGRSLDAVVAACIAIACKRQRIPRRHSEIIEVANISRKDLSRCIKTISKKLKIKVTPFSPEDFIPRYVAKLKLSGRVNSVARKIIQMAKEEGTTLGKSPESICGAAIYLACIFCKEKRAQKEIANTLEISDVTLRNRIKELSRIIRRRLDEFLSFLASLNISIDYIYEEEFQNLLFS